MTNRTDILLLGTGSFAGRILFDLAATAPVPTNVLVAGRNAQRLAWLTTAACARAHMFGRPVEVAGDPTDPSDADAVAALLARTTPKVVVQAASLQSAAVIAAKDTAWSRLVAEGGLSATAVFQAVITARVARACRDAAPRAHVVNCCFPDVVNGLIAAAGLPLTCGIGNIQILAHAFAGALPAAERRELKVLAHYQSIAPWRRPAAGRSGATARVWLGSSEIADALTRFGSVQLTPEPVIDISGAAGVPLIVALAHGQDWVGHAPGPLGLPGGYPVRVAGGSLALDLPAGLAREAAIAWNGAHEERGGLVVTADGRARYRGRLRDVLAHESPDLAAGFDVRDLERVATAMAELRARLS